MSRARRDRLAIRLSNRLIRLDSNRNNSTLMPRLWRYIVMAGSQFCGFELDFLGFLLVIDSICRAGLLAEPATHAPLGQDDRSAISRALDGQPLVVDLNPDTLELDFEDDSLTANMRCAYPMHYISNASETALGGHPKNVIMLTCDAFGVLPPIARLTPEQAVEHWQTANA